MANKVVTPGTTGNLATDLGGAPTAGDNIFINEGAVDYGTVPDWTGTSVNEVYIGEYFRGTIAEFWGLQVAGVFDNASSSPEINITAGAATIAEVRHQPRTGGLMKVTSSAGGQVTIVHSWGPMIVSAETVPDIRVHAGKVTVQDGNEITGAVDIDPGAECVLERDYTGGTVMGTLILNDDSMTPDGTTTVRSGGVLRVRKCGTWATTTAVLDLKAGGEVDFTGVFKPIVLEDFTHEAGAIIRKRRGTTPYTVAGTETEVGGGAQVIEV